MSGKETGPKIFMGDFVKSILALTRPLAMLPLIPTVTTATRLVPNKKVVGIQYRRAVKYTKSKLTAVYFEWVCSGEFLDFFVH